jgi:hypothetical protein
LGTADESFITLKLYNFKAPFADTKIASARKLLGIDFEQNNRILPKQTLIIDIGTIEFILTDSPDIYERL